MYYYIIEIIYLYIIISITTNKKRKGHLHFVALMVDVIELLENKNNNKIYHPTTKI